jgi:hypothetical protein
MPTNLTGSTIASSYDQLLHVDSGPTATEKTVYSGVGVATALKVGTLSASVDNVQIDGNTIATTNANGSLVLSPNGTGSVLATGAFGHGTGTGGAVTQGTSKSTTVVLDKVCGQITLTADELAANTTVSFAMTNSAVAAGDVLVLNHLSGGTAGSYLLNAQCGAGSATINVRNITGGALSEAIVIAFVVIKAVAA